METPRWLAFLRNHFTAVYAAINTGILAAVAAGWAPPDWVLWTISGLSAGWGALLYGSVSPATPTVRALDKEDRRF